MDVSIIAALAAAVVVALTGYIFAAYRDARLKQEAYRDLWAYHGELDATSPYYRAPVDSIAAATWSMSTTTVTTPAAAPCAYCGRVGDGAACAGCGAPR